MADRAAQFSPFAALTGHGAAISETARLTDRQIELSEDAKALLDQKQSLLTERLAEHPEVAVTWFQMCIRDSSLFAQKERGSLPSL